jgi:hypothetical protein
MIARLGGNTRQGEVQLRQVGHCRQALRTLIGDLAAPRQAQTIQIWTVTLE